ncbi:trimeric intracellular cation channel family protein [Aridibaculum aurantiacum]|uniref:trimeric intracellular cation channel family protein n=1 Tax=Aridibaculum aurantiacum TaxID=2810307 RepID=UPI001A9624A5|nr:TRIC cation channel family protein [Aridibaculum aurantiacum]
MNIIDIIIYIGIFVFAVTGALKARTNQMDIFGAGVLAFATAYGGGTLRDLLIGIRINWMNDYIALSLVVAAVLIVSLLKKNTGRFTATLFYTDAIGLGMFTIGGIERSLDNGINEVYAVIMGVMSATFGGLLGDILSNRVPALLTRGELYATACAIGGTAYLLMRNAGLHESMSLVITVIIVVGLRVISKTKQVTLPKI